MGGLALLRAKVGAECGAGIHTGKDGRVEQEGVWKGAACKRWQPFEWPGPGMFWPKWHIWWERRNHNKQPLQQASMNTLWTSSAAELWHVHTVSGLVCGKCFAAAAARTCNVSCFKTHSKWKASWGYSCWLSWVNCNSEITVFSRSKWCFSRMTVIE